MGLILNATWDHHEPTLPAHSKRSDRRTSLFPLGRLLTCARQIIRRLARLHWLRRPLPLELVLLEPLALVLVVVRAQ